VAEPNALRRFGAVDIFGFKIRIVFDNFSVIAAHDSVCEDALYGSTVFMDKNE